MSVVKDEVQVSIKFLTDESKAFANTIKDTERFRNELQKAQKEVDKLTKEQERLAAQGKDTTAVSLKLAAAEQRVNANLQSIAATGKDIAQIDLSKLLPSQLTQRATQLRQALMFIPDGHPDRVKMEQELKAINDRIAEMIARTKGGVAAAKEVEAAVGSYEALRKKIIEVESELKQLVPETQAFTEKSKQLREIEAEFKKVERALKGIEDVKFTEGSILNLKEQVKQLSTELGNLDPKTTEFVEKAKRLKEVEAELLRVEKAAKGIEDVKFTEGSILNLKEQVKQLSTELGNLDPKTTEFVEKAKRLKEVEAELLRVEKAAKGIEDVKFPEGSLGYFRQRAKEVRVELDQLQPGTKAFIEKLKELGIINKHIEKTDQELKKLSGTTSGLGGILENAFSFLLGGGILGIVTMIAGGLFNLGKSALKASADMESLKTTVQVFLGSGAAATKFLKDIQRFATDTPFEFPELAEAGKKLLAFGYSGDAAMKLLKRLGEVASAAQVPIGELAAIVGKAKLGQKIQGEELNQLADRGINVFPELARVLGTTEDKIKKLGSEGKISYQDLEKAIELATEKGGKFYGLMDKQSQTFTGLMSTLSDNFGQFVQTIFGGIGEGLKPVIKGVSDFFGQLTDFLRDGKQPVGEYAEVIQYAASVVKLLGNVFGIVWEVGKLLIGVIVEQVKVVSYLSNRVGDLIGWFVGLAAEAKKIPLIAFFFKPVLDAIGLVSDLLSNASATFAGFRAAAQQAIINVQNYMKALVIDTEIMAAKLISALSLDKATKDSIANQIAVWESQKSAMFATGKSVEQAYTEGRNAAIAVQTKIEADNTKKKEAEKTAKKEKDAKEAQKEENERLKKVKDALDLETKDKEIFYRREELANEIAFLKKQKTESDYNKQQIELERDKYTALIRVYDTYQSAFGEKTEQFRDLEIKKLEAQKKVIEANAQLAPRNVQEVEVLGKRQNTEGVKQSQTGSALDKLKSETDLENRLLQEKFAHHVLNEIDFENQKAAIRKRYADEALEAAIQKGEVEKGQITKLNEQKVAADNHYQETIRKNEQRTADLKAELEKVKLGLASEAFTVAIDLLSKDEAARKRNAGAIKAFQVGQIVVDGISEVQGIWKNANANPINAIIPGAGTAIAIAQTALAVGRSVGAIAKVNTAKFSGGGIAALKSGIFGGRPHSTGGTKGYFEDGTAVEVERDEAFVVVNKTNTPLLRALSYVNAHGGNGKNFFADGGVVNLNTNPTGFNASVSTPTVSVNINLDALTNEVKMLRRDVRETETNRKAYVVLDDFEAKQKSVNQDRSDASY